MYIKSVTIENFRCFGKKTTFDFNPGLTVLIGENDAGKSAVIDAIRYALGTTDQRWSKVDVSDFYNEDISLTITVSILFVDLSVPEAASFMECLTTDDSGKDVLYFNWSVKYMADMIPNRVIPSYTTGKNANQPQLSSAARELLRVTYLQPLRDAYSQMRAGKGSRLAQIIGNLPEVNKRGKTFEEVQNKEELSNLKLTEIYDLSNTLLANNEDIKSANQSIEEIVNQKMMIGSDRIETEISAMGSSDSVGDKTKLRLLLQKLDLNVRSVAGIGHGTAGLGTSNLLSMACEMLLYQKTSVSSFMLIEEPESHIHAQRQLKLIQSIQEGMKSSNQVIITTHSPLLASVIKLENLVLIQDKQAYSMKPEYTCLDESDYRYLEAYLDSTKANLFFARGVLIVEGPGEALLLPTVAKLMGRDFTSYGVSIVNVNSTGLRRYARIFQRKNEAEIINVPVSCITDRDVMPDCAPNICVDKKYTVPNTWPNKNDRRWTAEYDFTFSDDGERLAESVVYAKKAEHIAKIKEKADGQRIKTFVADYWTLEYDLAFAGLADVMLETISFMQSQVHTSKSESKYMAEYKAKYESYGSSEEKASYVYHFFSKNIISKAEFAQYFAAKLEDKYIDTGMSSKIIDSLPTYLVHAIMYVTGTDMEGKNE